MSDIELKPCPNGCSSAGEVWNGEGLEVCPVCHGNTTIPTLQQGQDAPETIAVCFMNGVPALVELDDVSLCDAIYTRTDIADARIADLRSSLTTALKLLRDRKGVPHWDRPLSTADNDVLRMVAELTPTS